MPRRIAEPSFRLSFCSERWISSSPLWHRSPWLCHRNLGSRGIIACSMDRQSPFFCLYVDGSIPFFWGTDSEGHLLLSDDAEIVTKGCGKSSAPFPKGCFFTSSGGLRSFELPLNELKPGGQ